MQSQTEVCDDLPFLMSQIQLITDHVAVDNTSPLLQLHFRELDVTVLDILVNETERALVSTM